MNRQRILIISSLCLLLGSNTSLAGERTEREMLSIAQLQLAKGAKTRSVLTIEKLAEERFYNVYGDENRFVIVSRENSFTPVLAYSDSHFDAASLPCGMQWWLGAISEQMEAKSQVATSATRAVSFEQVPYLCKTKWNQGDPYNFFTPELNGSHTPTGCVATAMSQIMKYFSYPAQGKGKGYYTLNGSSSRVNENIAGVYKWDQMQDTYNEASLTDEIREPVARLMKDAGLATNMNYGTNGSGAFSVTASRGFCYNFSYDSLALHCYYREYFDNEMWMNTIYRELADGRPILYTGVASSGGHAFVFDGVDEEGRIHVNWGWGGSGDGYYDFADLNPLDDRGNPTNSHYNEQQSMVYGFKCQEKPDENESYASLWCTNDGEQYTLSVSGKLLTVQSPPVYNYHFLWFYGQFGVYFKDINGDSEKNMFLQIGQNQTGIATFFGTNDLSQTIFFTKVKPGNYQVYLASKALNESDYQPVRCDGGAPYYELTIGEDGKTSISESKFLPESTGVNSVKVSSRQSGRIYDLHGRRLDGSAESLPKGIYIIDGKKVVK